MVRPGTVLDAPQQSADRSTAAGAAATAMVKEPAAAGTAAVVLVVRNATTRTAAAGTPRIREHRPGPDIGLCRFG